MHADAECAKVVAAKGATSFKTLDLVPPAFFNERSLYRHLESFVDYYHRSRVHLALEKDTPEPRPIQPLEFGRIVSIPVLGGLHHRYERRAA